MTNLLAPRYSGAISSVTDGSPEDINEMPPSAQKETQVRPGKNFIPDEAIRTSDAGRIAAAPQKGAAPPVDKYSGEKISANSPTDMDVKSGPVDDTVTPG